jgi:hypothetical protein
LRPLTKQSNQQALKDYDQQKLAAEEKYRKDVAVHAVQVKAGQ